MPYRRLPNTDAARVRALKTALKKNETAATIHDSAYSPPLKQKIDIFLPKFETAIMNSRIARQKQSEDSGKFSELTRKARLYISHFIQVLNFTIARGELKPQARTFYGLDEEDSKVPSLLTEQELLKWGEKVVQGEQERLNNRMGNPIYNPTIALVRVNYENFRQHFNFHKQLQVNVSRFSEEIKQFREEADRLIVMLWDEVEAYFSGIPNDEKRRELCEEYGVAYVFRKGEMERIAKEKEAERITLKLPFPNE